MRAEEDMKKRDEEIISFHERLHAKKEETKAMWVYVDQCKESSGLSLKARWGKEVRYLKKLLNEKDKKISRFYKTRLHCCLFRPLLSSQPTEMWWSSGKTLGAAGGERPQVRSLQKQQRVSRGSWWRVRRASGTSPKERGELKKRALWKRRDLPGGAVRLCDSIQKWAVYPLQEVGEESREQRGKEKIEHEMMLMAREKKSGTTGRQQWKRTSNSSLWKASSFQECCLSLSLGS